MKTNFLVVMLAISSAGAQTFLDISPIPTMTVTGSAGSDSGYLPWNHPVYGPILAYYTRNVVAPQGAVNASTVQVGSSDPYGGSGFSTFYFPHIDAPPSTMATYTVSFFTPGLAPIALSPADLHVGLVDFDGGDGTAANSEQAHIFGRDLLNNSVPLAGLGYIGGGSGSAADAVAVVDATGGHLYGATALQNLDGTDRALYEANFQSAVHSFTVESINNMNSSLFAINGGHLTIPINQFPNGDYDFNAGDAFYLSSDPIPEPSSLGLLALAGALVFFRQRNVAR